MNYTAAITSKRQLTIPAAAFRDLNLNSGERVIVTVDKKNKSLKIQSQLALVQELAGSISVPKHLREIDIDVAIKKGRDAYIQRKYGNGIR